MDERRYQELADDALRQLEGMFEDVDAEDVDLERSGDVLTLTFKGGKRAVINTQRPTRQIWLAANARAWHFSYEAPSGLWLDDKEKTTELIDQVIAIVRDVSGLTLSRPS